LNSKKELDYTQIIVYIECILNYLDKYFLVRTFIKDENGDLDLTDQELESLEGSPSYVEGSFYCSGNPLSSLEGGPKYVEKSYDCSWIRVGQGGFSLKGAPVYVGNIFNCEDDNTLYSLEGCPSYVGEDFIVDSEFMVGESVYIIIASLIRGRYHRHVKEGKEFKKHILDHLNNYLTL